jgi:predicted ATPase/class 3 adenylate cyclase
VNLPVGTVTFLLTDIAGSTVLWQQGDDAMAAAVARHYEILDAVVTEHGGMRPVEQGEGDSTVAVFTRAGDAIAAAVAAQRALQHEPWPTNHPISVRMGIHTGEARLRDAANYVGLTVILAARLRNIAHGGQILVSEAACLASRDELGEHVTLRDLGEHRLKDLHQPERAYQVMHPDVPTEFAPLASAGVVPTNLPHHLSPFVGRHGELAELEGLLATDRLLTLTGAGGAGKTRLAALVADRRRTDFPDGVWWIELAATTGGGDVVAAVADALGLVLDEATDATESITRRIGNDRTLLVLDNCEHVLEPVGALASALLAACPRLSVLATSRGPLGIAGEQTWRVPPLSVPPRPGPDAAGLVRPADLEQYDAIRLFVDRAQRSDPNFALDDDTGATVAEICRRLDGIPLAIEFAAARAKLMSPTDILGGHNDALALLTSGTRHAPARHQTLEASIAWSVDLLSDPERQILGRLSCFRRSFDLAAAAELCSAGAAAPSMLDTVERLVDHSLVTVLDDDGRRRFTLLETVRQFADRLLQQTDDVDALHYRHAAYYARLAHDIGSRVETADELAAIDALEADAPNLRAALGWYWEHREVDALADMARALGPFWDLSGALAESAVWFTRALDLLPDASTPARAQLLSLRGEVRLGVADYFGALTDTAAAIELAEANGDDVIVGRSCSTLATMYGYADFESWGAMADRAEAALARGGDHYALADAQYFRSVPLMLRGYYREASEALDRALPGIRATGNPGLRCGHLQFGGFVALGLGDLTRAEECCLEAIELGGLRSAAQVAGAHCVVAAVATYRGIDHPWRAGLIEHGHRARRDGEELAAVIWHMYGVLHLVTTDPAAARAVADAALAASSGLVPLIDVFSETYGALGALGAGDHDDAWERTRRADPLAAAADALFCTVINRRTQAIISIGRGDLVAAECALAEALAAASQHDMLIELCRAIEVAALVAEARGRHEEAARTWGAAQPMRDQMRLARNLIAVDGATTAGIERVRAALGPERFNAAYAAGATVPVADTVSSLLASLGAP